MVAIVIGSVTTTLVDLVGQHGVLAVFVLMGVDALLPVGGELIMLLAGALAAGAIGHGTAGFATGPEPSSVGPQAAAPAGS
jgi:membrane protein DedA with SNARE-associated domain